MFGLDSVFTLRKSGGVTSALVAHGTVLVRESVAVTCEGR